jgi:hypothetical protein
MYYDNVASGRARGEVTFAGLVAGAPLLPPGGFGTLEAPSVPFHNLPTRSRERQALTDRETLEKSRLRERTGGRFVYADPGHVIAPDDSSSALYLDSRLRFTTDAVTEARVEKDARIAHRASDLLRRREETMVREEERWKRMEAESRAAELRVASLQTDGGKARRNKSGLPFDPVTLNYHASHDGDLLRFQDDSTKFRAALRTQTLQQKGRGVDYNVLTGSS